LHKEGNLTKDEVDKLLTTENEIFPQVIRASAADMSKEGALKDQILEKSQQLVLESRNKKSTTKFLRQLIEERDREIAGLEELHKEGNLTKDEVDKFCDQERDKYEDAKRQRLDEGTRGSAATSSSAIFAPAALENHDGQAKNSNSLIVAATNVIATSGSSADLEANQMKTSPITINIRIPSGGPIMLKIKRDTKFSRIFLAVAANLRIEDKSLRFVYNKERLDPEQTPSMHDMEDGDQIDCTMVQQCDIRADPITLNIQYGHEPMKIKVKTNTLFEKIFSAIAVSLGIDKNLPLRFMFDGHTLFPHETPNKYEMENGDQIDVMVEMRGD
jgi:small ubiquitin-related modifier